MNASLGRFCRRRKKPEGVFVREMLMDFLERHDPRYVQEIEAEASREE
jgi:hypothetical protein